MVSASLRNLLIGEMQLTPAVDVTVLAPDERGSERRINLFLYKLQENEFLKNQDVTVRPGDPNRLVPPPLSLNLFYLMTPYAQNDPEAGNAAAHQIVGDAMRVFFEHPVVPEDYLEDGLADARELLQITISPLDTEELSRIWSTFAQPFRLSVLYQISTVQLDALPEAEQPMPKRVRTVGVPGVRQPPTRPAVTGMSPMAGAAGTVLTFTGEDLAGWKASVTMGGRRILDGQALTGGQFVATIPADLLPGLYDVRVQVSGLFRRTFLFEVTP
jgi:hypothetical protein